MSTPNIDPPSDSAAHVVGVPRSVRYWSVTVAVEGMDVVTIESNCLSGVENVTDYRPEIIEAAEHLLAFIGTGDDPDFDFEDMPNSVICGENEEQNQ